MHKILYIKKWLLVLLVSWLATTVDAADFEVDGIYYNVTSESTVMVVSNVGESGTGMGIGGFYKGDIVIPAYVENNGVAYEVTAAKEYLFMSSTKLTSISLPHTLVDLGDEPFAACARLTAITVDEDNPVYSSIDGVLFDKKAETLISFPCARTGEYIVPQTVKTIAPSAFYSCTKLKTVKIPDQVTEIGTSAFRNCLNLTTVNLPEGITVLRDNVFRGCSYLNHVVLSRSLVSIGSHVFYYCQSLDSIALPQGVRSIGTHAFDVCPRLAAVTSLASSLPVIDENVFAESSYERPLYVPSRWVDSYKNDPRWGLFKDIRAIGEEMTATAENVFAGALFSLQLKLNNVSQGITGYGCRLRLPEGISLAHDQRGNYFHLLSGRHPVGNHQVSITQADNGDWLLECHLVDGATLTGEEGEIVELTLATTRSLSGSYQGELSDARLYFDDGTSCEIAGGEIALNVNDWLFGDVNLNGIVDVVDAMIAVDYILGDEKREQVRRLADVSLDNMVTVSDVMMIVDIILGY